jgi:spermidine/putrescine transport system substrate-binding protein
MLFWGLLIFGALYLPKWRALRIDANTINVFVWGDILNGSVVADFENKTGIKINLSYYSSNEELIVKMKATRAEGYDLIIPSDYAVPVLTKEGLLKPLNKEKFLYWEALNPHLLNHYFDPDNTYSIPFEWELFGFGIDKDYFDLHPTRASWNMLFNPDVIHYKIAMGNDPIDAVAFAGFYLYGDQHILNAEQSEAVKRVLKAQRPYVSVYANFRADYFLATRNVSLVLASTSYIWRAKQFCDFVKFVVPEEGTFMAIENFCIPKPSTKEDLVFKFINHLCSAESVVAHFKTQFLFPATNHALSELLLDKDAAPLLLSTEKDFKRYHLIRPVLPEKEMRDIWIDVKS